MDIVDNDITLKYKYIKTLPKSVPLRFIYTDENDRLRSVNQDILSRLSEVTFDVLYEEIDNIDVNISDNDILMIYIREALGEGYDINDLFDSLTDILPDIVTDSGALIFPTF